MPAPLRVLVLAAVGSLLVVLVPVAVRSLLVVPALVAASRRGCR